MYGRTLAPALATGNATVLKPAEDACLTCLRLTELAQEAGLPAGALNVVTGYGATAGAALADHPDINFVSFTGSPEAGTLVQIASAQHHRPCVLELGENRHKLSFQMQIWRRFYLWWSQRLFRMLVKRALREVACLSKKTYSMYLLKSLVPALRISLLGPMKRFKLWPSHQRKTTWAGSAIYRPM